MHVSYEAYHRFSSPLEGRVPTMYCDCKGLITTGVGNLINTQASALALPWLLADGSLANQADVLADWNKLHVDAAHYALLKWMVYAKDLRCHLSEEAIDALVKRTLAANEAIFRKRYSLWDFFPADAQIAIMSVAWAVGPAFWTTPHPGFTNLDRYIAAQDWEGCVAACTIKEAGNPGVVPRNAKNRFCFHNAALMKADDTNNDDQLSWPELYKPGANVPVLLAAAEQSKKDAELKLAAWHALDLNPFTPLAGEALHYYEAASASDTDPSPPPSEA